MAVSALRCSALATLLVATTLSSLACGQKEPEQDDAPAAAGPCEIPPAAHLVPRAVLIEDGVVGGVGATTDGRARLCVGDVPPMDANGSCQWTPWAERLESVIMEARLDPNNSLSLSIDFTAVQPDVTLSAFDAARGQTTSYRSALPSTVQVWTDDGGRRGIVILSAIPLEFSERDDAPPTIDGVVRWECEPADPAPGLAHGRMTVVFDAPANLTLELGAECRWIDENGAQVHQIAALPRPIGADDQRQLAVLLDLPSEATGPYEPTLTIKLLEGVREVRYEPTPPAPIIIQSVPGDGHGQVRFRHLINRGLRRDSLDGTDKTDRVSGRILWACDDPQVDPAGVGAVVPPPSLDGMATLTLAGLAVSDAAATCTLDRPQAEAGAMIVGLTAAFEIGDERVRLLTDQGFAVLFRTDRHGNILGEYETPDPALTLPLAVGSGPQTVEANLTFSPTDPAYSPVGGPAGPRRLAATITYDCAVPSA